MNEEVSKIPEDNRDFLSDPFDSKRSLHGKLGSKTGMKLEACWVSFDYASDFDSIRKAEPEAIYGTTVKLDN